MSLPAEKPEDFVLRKEDATGPLVISAALIRRHILSLSMVRNPRFPLRGHLNRQETRELGNALLDLAQVMDD